MTKRCSACKQVKPLTAFSRATRRPDGYQARCKECNKIEQRNFRARQKQARYSCVCVPRGTFVLQRGG